MGSNSVIEFSDHTITYKYASSVYKSETVLHDGTVKVTEYAMIVLKKIAGTSVREVILPVSLFLFKPIPKKGIPKINTQLARANVVVSFLNYVFIDNIKQFQIENICELEFQHGQTFLNSFRDSGLSKKTIEAKERVLINFYFYLAENNVLDNIHLDDFQEGFYYYDSHEKKYTKSPFVDTIYPEEKLDNVLHNLPTELIIPFLDTSMLYTPRITLGLYCQFFGGLRVGEVVNMTKASIAKKGPFCQYGLTINLKNRDLRRDLKSPSSGGAVKRIRKQAVYPYRGDVLMKIYKYHIENFVKKDESGAMFWGANGKPMTEDTYYYYFNKLKDKFLQRLLESDDIRLKNYALELKAKKWSTHIGRGVFSNMIAEVSKNISQIRQARGDKTFEASMTYLSDTTKMAKLLMENQQDMWAMLVGDVEDMFPEANNE